MTFLKKRNMISSTLEAVQFN